MTNEFSNLHIERIAYNRLHSNSNFLYHNSKLFHILSVELLLVWIYIVVVLEMSALNIGQNGRYSIYFILIN